ncbi:MAG: hypothetical protein Q4E75_06815 [bacterium]|nr:hypothetical protein [bacterium]
MNNTNNASTSQNIINNNENQNINPQPQTTMNNTNIQPQVLSNQNHPLDNKQVNSQMQQIPTIEQTNQNFLNNTQNNVSAKEQKKPGINYTFLIILLIILFGAVIFLFPYLFKTL